MKKITDRKFLLQITRNQNKKTIISSYYFTPELYSVEEEVMVVSDSSGTIEENRFKYNSMYVSVGNILQMIKHPGITDINDDNISEFADIVSMASEKMIKLYNVCLN